MKHFTGRFTSVSAFFLSAPVLFGLLIAKVPDHCIEYLRQALMCYPDTSFTTFMWTHSDPKPVLDVEPYERKCVDWEYFMQGITSKVVSFEEVDELRNPLLSHPHHL